MQGLHYYWSASQSEYATDILLDEPKNLQPLYRQFIHHAVKTFQSPDLMRFLGIVAALLAACDADVEQLTQIAA